ncbi:hypothetical protein [Microvirga arabica]|uniref:hypothetical protein n=1 Tax=Microvirga arabica TaxID=1128671 RepID=UPI00193960CF|nr:hypothetical protein [Microvirga arabica]MBM1169912.1 hypothetical protein [Microvirga arabica]
MVRKASSRKRRSNSEHLTTIFATSHPLLPREVKELAKYGPPVGVPASAPTRAGFGEFTDHGFQLKEGGVRALLFLIINKRGKVIGILAWAPLIGRLSPLHRNSSVFTERKTVRSNLGTNRSGIEGAT